MKKVWKSILVAALCAALTPVNAFAASETEMVPSLPELRDTEHIALSEEEAEAYIDGKYDDSTLDVTPETESETELLLQYSGAIREALLNGDTQVDLSELPITKDNEQFHHIGYYCPYFDGVNITGKAYYYPSSGAYAYLLITNNLSEEETEAWVEEVDAKMAELVSLVSDDTVSVSDRVLLLHDYMDSHYHYASPIETRDYYPGVMLTDKVGVCQSYAYLFQYVMNTVGVECYTTTSSSMNHAWNIVGFDEDQDGETEYYQLDITWDDPVQDDFGQAKHKYLLLSDETMSDSSHSHYSWDLTNYACEDTTFEDAYYVSATSPVVQIGSDRYYVDANGLEKYDVSSGTRSLIASLGVWGKFGGTGYYSQKCAGLFYYRGKIYTNTVDSILAYNPQLGLTETYATISTADGYVFGIVDEGTTLYYDYETGRGVTYNSKDIRSLSLPEIVQLQVPAVSVSVQRGSSANKIAVTGTVLDYEEMASTGTYYEITGQGVLYSRTETLGSDALTVRTAGRTKVNFDSCEEDGTYQFAIAARTKETSYTVRAWASYEDESGNTVYVYSEPMTVSCAGL